ncbi:hypothetical protein ACLOJK_032120 [Asimina triloba]
MDRPTVVCTMGEEAKQEEPKPETKQEEKKEEKAEEKSEEKKEEKPEEKKEEPKPPSPVILFVDMHCVGCAKRVERCIMKCRGVEAVDIDMGQNTVKIKGIVDPQALCMRIQKKTKRRAKVLSPLPPPEGEESKPEVVTSEVSGPSTVVLNVNMHCEACAEQLQSKILKLRGVQSVETELSASKVTVTGTMDAERLVEYVYRRTRKVAKIVPQPEEKAPEEKKAEEAPKAAEEAPKEAEEKKEEGAEKKEEEKPAEEGNKSSENAAAGEEKPAEAAPAEAAGKAEDEEVVVLVNDDMAKRMMYWPPMYVIERIPPPQLFSDENPNACCIS